MKTKLPFKKSKVYGLDIGDSGIKLALISKNPEGITLEDLYFYDFPYSRESPNKQILIQGINTLINKLEERSEEIKVVANLYNTEPIVKYLNLPYMTEDELNTSIKWQAQRFIVYNIDKMIIDYAILNIFEEMGKKKMNVIIVGVSKEEVLKTTELLKEIGIEPVSFNIDCVVQFNYIKEKEAFREDETVGVVDMGAKSAIIQIIDNGIPGFGRKCNNIGSWEINKSLKNTLNIDFEETEKIKKEFSPELIETDFNSKVKAVINKAMEEILIEIKRSLDYYYDISPQKRIERLILTGGGASLRGLDFYLAQGLGISVELFDPLKDIIFSKKIKELDLIKKNSLRFTTVLGLALEAAV